MLALLVLCSFVSLVAGIFVLRFGRGSGRRYSLFMPQRFHAGHVPRLGGLAMLVACIVGWFWMALAERFLPVVNQIPFTLPLAVIWCVAAILAAGAGIGEDLTHRVQARWRLVLTMAASAVAVGLLELRIPRLDLPGVDLVLGHAPWLGAILALLAVAGLPHAFNLIDGYNGLAGIVALICSFALAYVCLLVGDRQLAAVALVLAGATVGFLVWNYPRGLIFAGDGGAYLWGVVIAVVSIQLVQRYEQVSPWFPALLLIYPVWETLFSIYRKLVRGQSPSVADALHFHQLIYRRIVRGVFHDDEARRMLMRNNRTSPYLWSFALLTVVPASLFWQNSVVLMGFCLLFVLSYIYAYVSIVRFKVPRWFQR